MKQVFINYSWQHDTKNAERIYDALAGYPSDFKVWMDKRSMEPGLKWRPAILKAIRESDYFIAVLSKGSVNKRGFANTELYEAIEVLKEFPPDQVFLVPTRVENCISPFSQLHALNYLDLFPNWNSGMQKLLSTLGVKQDTLTFINSAHPSAFAKPTEKKRKKQAKPVSYYKVGLVDVDLGLKNMKRVVASLNKTQQFFHFTLPAMPALKNVYIKEEGLKNLFIPKVPRSYISKHRHMDVDLMACISKYPLAYDEGGYRYSNFFAVPSEKDKRFMFLSADQLQEFSAEAGTRYEEGIVYMLAGQLVDYFTDEGYHKETRGCLMDHCGNRRDIIQGFKKRKLCKACGKLLPKGALRDAIDALLRWKYS